MAKVKLQVTDNRTVNVEGRIYRAGARSPSFETWDRICRLYGWPQTFAVTGTRGAD